MVLIPEEYYTKLKKVELTQQDIDIIVDTLERVEHNIFTFQNLDRIINKLRK